jgi:hypothetical protein
MLHTSKNGLGAQQKTRTTIDPKKSGFLSDPRFRKQKFGFREDQAQALFLTMIAAGSNRSPGHYT